MRKEFKGRLSELLQRAYVCRSGEHHYGILQRRSAEKCCNGFVRFEMPSRFGEDVEAWLSENDRPFEIQGCWDVVFIPDYDTETIERFKRRNKVWTEMARNPTLQVPN